MNKYEEALDNLCHNAHGDMLDDRYRNELCALVELVTKEEKLEKALDKAIEEIIYLQTKLNGSDFTNTKEQLKEWLLNDE